MLFKITIFFTYFLHTYVAPAYLYRLVQCKFENNHGSPISIRIVVISSNKYSRKVKNI